MSIEEFVKYLEERIYPYRLRENSRAAMATLFRKYPEDLLVECIDIGIERYFDYDEDGNLIQSSVQLFLDKLGGIAYNKSRTPINQEIYRIKNTCKKSFVYWNEQRADEIFHDYISSLKDTGGNEQQILVDLQTEATRISKFAHNWSQWSKEMLDRIHDIRQQSSDDTEMIEQLGSIIPDAIANETPLYLQKLIRQINASYENNLFDCCAVMMRRLLEILLVLSFQNMEIENEIMDKSGTHHVTLDKIIQIAEQNPRLALSSNTRKDMRLFKDLGNFSAHKIWYNCTQHDIKPHVLKYRVIIEELIYKAGLR